MRPLPAPPVPGDTEAERMDAAVKTLFSASKAGFLKEEAKYKAEQQRKKLAKKGGFSPGRSEGRP